MSPYTMDMFMLCGGRDEKGSFILVHKTCGRAVYECEHDTCSDKFHHYIPADDVELNPCVDEIPSSEIEKDYNYSFDEDTDE